MKENKVLFYILFNKYYSGITLHFSRLQAAMIAAIYVVLCIAFAPISYGAIQARVAEALTILPYFTPAAIPGLFGRGSP